MNSLTTLAQVKQYVDVGDVSDEAINQLIGDASLRVKQDKVQFGYQEYAARLFTAHLLMLRKQGSNSALSGVTTEKVGPIERDYAAYARGSSTYDDPYIKEYEQLLTTLADGGGENVGHFV